MFDVQAAREHLAELARAPVFEPAGGWPAGAPVSEYTRSPAARRVGNLAAQAGLFSFHYEHRAHLELPDDWVPLDRFDLAEPPRWEGGVLPERKYQSFRHDLPVASFHPGHRAKWSTHELCHGLVGFAWASDATPFFHATAGRLAELLPVVLWYFLDEAFLRRCPAHAQGGALFGPPCAACEAVAGCVPEDPDATELLSGAARYLDRELAAVARSRRDGRPLSFVHGTLDLASDGVAYAGAHGPRLGSEAFQRYAERFLVPAGGWSPSLEALEARVVSVARALVGQGEPEPLAPSAVHGRWRWVLQDLGWRLCQVRHDTGGEAREALDVVIDLLAGAVAATTDPGAQVAAVAEAAVRQAADGYRDLAEAWVLPPVEEVFAVGHPLPHGLGTHLPGLEDGVRSCTPLLAEALGEGLPSEVARFARQDQPRREVLAHRWAAHLEGHRPGLAADLGRYEVALAAAPPGDGTALALGGGAADGRLRLAEGLSLHHFGCDVVALAERLEQGEGGLVGEASPTALVLGRDGAGEGLVVDLDPLAAEALEALGEGAEPRLEPQVREALRQLGVLVPVAWAERISDRRS